MTPGEQKIRSMADRLVSTLNTLMPSDKADAIVGEVAAELYEVLGITGEIVVKSTSFVHGGFGKNGKKAMIVTKDYEFKETK